MAKTGAAEVKIQIGIIDTGEWGSVCARGINAEVVEPQAAMIGEKLDGDAPGPALPRLRVLAAGRDA